MQIGMIGLGRMGANIARRLLQYDHAPVVYNRGRAAVDALVSSGAEGATDLGDLAARLQPPRTVWVMLPAGEVTESTIDSLADLLAPGDIIIDGGNSFWKDDIRRAKTLKQQGLHYIDVGTSGGIWGLDLGYCMMIGGEADIIEHLDPIFAALAPGGGKIEDSRAMRGYIHAGPNGAGHFVKMIHNGIEYGMMQAFAEGFDILKNASSEALPPDQRYDFDLAEIAEVWRHGSVVRSWLLDLTASALAEDGMLADYSGHVEDSGEGRWTLMAAIEEAVPADVLSAALYARFRSRQQHTFAEKILSAMRKGFGGHVEPHVAPRGGSGDGK